MTYSKLNVEPREDRTVRLTQNGNEIILNSGQLPTTKVTGLQ